MDIKKLLKAGMDFDKAFVIQIKVKARLIEREVTAIFAFNDLMAYGIYKQAQEQGIRIPEQISVVGFDDIFISEILTPKLTSVKQPTYEMGLISSAILIKSIKGEKLEKTKMEFKPTLSIRKSVGPPPKKGEAAS